MFRCRQEAVRRKSPQMMHDERDGCYLVAGARTGFREASPLPKTKNCVRRPDTSGNLASISMTLNSVVLYLKTYCTIIQRKKTPVVVIQTKVHSKSDCFCLITIMRWSPATYMMAEGTAETCWATWKAALWEERESKNLLRRTRR
ncbi:hypothetical protein OPV22_033943 [Ensete ventricosum]|uniref:Uncharacterized protein n=1 Tax=Ensete ventricosum TaxID=4639 RepID=A0AAV8PZN6_ENSVE|nr:hypothetical protein OPV22_033943 [Ensete ventricosum]